MWDILSINLQALRTTVLLKRDSCEICEIFKNTLFNRTYPVGVSDSYRFLTWNFVKKEICAKIFFCEFWKIFKNILWQNTFWWLLLKFICEFWEVLQNIKHFFYRVLWETPYFMYKLQNFNQQIQLKTISQVVLFKHFMQERKVAFPRRAFT